MTTVASKASIEDVARSDLKSACQKARAFVAEHPRDEEAAKLLTEVVQALVREAPERADADRDLPPPLRQASQLLSAEQDEPAELILRRYVAAHPKDVRAMSMMAEIAARCDFYDDAHRILQRALEIEPNSVDVLLTLAKLVNHVSYLEHRDQGDEALKIVERALEIDPTNVSAASLHSSILIRFRRLSESVASYNRLLDLDPLHWLAWTNYGSMLNSIGRFGDAIAALRTAAAINPRNGLAWWEIANLKVSKLFASDIERMLGLLEDPETDVASQTYLHFALARGFDQAKRFEEAAEHLQLGNALKQQSVPHDADQVSVDVANSERVFTPAFFEVRREFGDQRPDPIFIVGMQRSGTTLVEQILASHSAVEGTEELFLVLQIARDLTTRHPDVPWQVALDRVPFGNIRALGEGFLSLARQHRRTSRPLFVDKNPANWRLAGLIATMLPRAKIIDVRRDPMDCCFANYAQHYENGVAFSYSQTGLGRYYADYVQLMRHFDRVAPGLVHRVIYEDLVDDLESNVRSMLDYLGLPFEESCLRFFETDRPVLTPSSQQVRQPINRSGIGRWRNYERFLGELAESLGDTLLDWRR